MEWHFWKVAGGCFLGSSLMMRYETHTHRIRIETNLFKTFAIYHKRIYRHPYQTS